LLAVWDFDIWVNHQVEEGTYKGVAGEMETRHPKILLKQRSY
jgi:hypothetical protein